MEFKCIKCGVVYEYNQRAALTELMTGRKYIRCPKDHAYAYQNDWNESGRGVGSEAVKELQDEINRQNKRLEEAKAHIKEVSTKLAQTEEKVQSLEEVEKSQQEKIKRLELTLDALEEDKARLEAELEALATEKEDAIAHLQKELSETNEEVERVKEELAQSAQEYKVLKDSFDALLEAKKVVEENLAQLKSELEASLDSVRVLEKQKVELETSLTEAVQDAEAKGARIISLEKTLEDVRGERDRFKAEVNSEKAAHTKTKSEKASVEKSLTEAVSELEKAEEQLSQALRKVGELEGALEEAASEIEYLDGELARNFWRGVTLSDEATWETGGLDFKDGTPIENNLRVRTKDYIELPYQKELWKVKMEESNDESPVFDELFLTFYDGAKKKISRVENFITRVEKAVDPPSNAEYIKMELRTTKYVASPKDVPSSLLRVRVRFADREEHEKGIELQRKLDEAIESSVSYFAYGKWGLVPEEKRKWVVGSINMMGKEEASYDGWEMRTEEISIPEELANESLTISANVGATSLDGFVYDEDGRLINSSNSVVRLNGGSKIRFTARFVKTHLESLEGFDVRATVYRPS